jgi:hypothetical protein
VYGMFTVTPIVNRYTGKAIRLCITAVEAALPKSRFCKIAPPENGIAPGRSFTRAAVFGTPRRRRKRGVRYKTEVNNPGTRSATYIVKNQ